MNCITKLSGMGYRFYIDNGNLRYKFEGIKPPPNEQITPLFNELKTHKTQAITFVSDFAKETKQEQKGNKIGTPYAYLSKCERSEAMRRDIKNLHMKYAQANIKCEWLKVDLIKGIQKGEDVYNLLLKAMECISLLCNDDVLFMQAQKDIETRLTPHTD